MSQTNVCINRVFKFYIKYAPWGLKLLCSRKKYAIKIKRNRKKNNDGCFTQDY